MIIWWPNTVMVRTCTRVISVGASAVAAASTIFIRDCWTATIRPRMASSTWEPMMVSPVRNATPALAPTRATATSATHRCGASATTTRARPAATMAVPNSRLWVSRRASRGAVAMPTARPTNTATNSMLNAVSPPSRLNA